MLPVPALPWSPAGACTPSGCCRVAAMSSTATDPAGQQERERHQRQPYAFAGIVKQAVSSAMSSAAAGRRVDSLGDRPSTHTPAAIYGQRQQQLWNAPSNCQHLGPCTLQLTCHWCQARTCYCALLIQCPIHCRVHRRDDIIAEVAAQAPAAWLLQTCTAHMIMALRGLRPNEGWQRHADWLEGPCVAAGHHLVGTKRVVRTSAK